jgi:hypothetical protein
MDQVSGQRLGDPEAAALRDALDLPGEHRGRRLFGRRRCSRAWLAVDQRVERRVLQAKRHVLIPAAPQVLDGIDADRRVHLAAEVLLHAVLRDRVQEALLVAKQPVDRGSLHPGGVTDGARRDRFPATLSQ